MSTVRATCRVRATFQAGGALLAFSARSPFRISWERRDFIEQLTDIGNVGIFLGNLMHVVGLIAAVAGGIEMVRRRQSRPIADGAA
jgi:hypothetical protein